MYRNLFKFLYKNNITLINKIDKVLNRLKNNHHHQSLKSHKANTKKYGIKYSSTVTSDIRIIWDFDNECISIIQIIDIGGHSGKYKVYK